LKTPEWFRSAEPAGLLLGAIVGALCGVVAICFALLVDLIETVVLGSGASPVEALARIPWYWRLIIPAGGGLLVAPIVYRWASEARGHGVPEVIEAVAMRSGEIRPRVVAAKSIASAITIGTGGSVGREGPVVQIGAGIGSVLGSVLSLSREQRRNLVGCGAAAGIAATFNAPIAAAFFALEVILGNFAVATFGPIVLASVAATAVSRTYFGDAPAFAVPPFDLASWWELLTYLGLGLVSGLVACAFIWLLYRLEDKIDGSRITPLLRPAVGGLALGGLLLMFPELYGSGFEAIEGVLHGHASWQLACLLVFAKVAASSVTLASGGSGGVFSPSLFIGAVTGFAIGSGVQAIAPFETASPSAYALIGMGAVLGGTTHAPISSILMLFELTGTYEIILPTMLATTVSTVTARGVLGESIYSMKLVRKGIRLLGGREETVMTTFRVRDVMTTEVRTVREGTALPTVVSAFLDAPIMVAYVVDEEHRLTGMISLHDIKEILTEHSLDDLVVAHDLMVPAVSVVQDDRLADCMARFSQAGNESLPVLADPHSRRLVGRITRRDLVDLYDREVLRRELLGTVAAADVQQIRPAALPAGHHLRRVTIPRAWVGDTLRHLDLRRATGVTVISIQAAGDSMEATNPEPDRPLEANDVLVVLGSRSASAALDALMARAIVQ